MKNDKKIFYIALSTMRYLVLTIIETTLKLEANTKTFSIYIFNHSFWKNNNNMNNNYKASKTSCLTHLYSALSNMWSVLTKCFSQILYHFFQFTTPLFYLFYMALPHFCITCHICKLYQKTFLWEEAVDVCLSLINKLSNVWNARLARNLQHCSTKLCIHLLFQVLCLHILQTQLMIN